MKKIIPLLIIAFFVCAVLSYLLFSKFIPPASNSTPTSSLASNGQKSILLVLLNEIEGSNPEPISIWVLIIYKSDSSIINIMPLYPTGDDQKDNPIRSQFALDDQKNLSLAFLADIQSRYDLPLKEYVMIDSKGAAILSNWLLGKKSTLPQKPPTTANLASPTISLTQRFLQSICDQLPALSSNTSPFQWNQILSKHFRTTLLFDDVVASLEDLQNKPFTGKCEVYGSQ